MLLGGAGAGVAYLALDGQIGAPPDSPRAPVVLQSGAGAPFKTAYGGAQSAPEPPPDRAIYARMTERAATAAPASPAAPAQPAESANTKAPKSTAQEPALAPRADPAPNAAVTETAYGVQLGAFSSEAASRTAWTRAQTQAGAALSGLSPDISPAVQEGRTLHRLRAGAFADRAKAEALCAALQARTVSCLVVRR
jgi:cell division septation protein DedD